VSTSAAPESSRCNPPATSPSFRLGLVIVLTLAVCLCDLSRPFAVGALAAVSVGAVLVARVPAHVLLLRVLPLFSFGLVGLALLLLAPVGEGVATVPLPLWSRPVPEQGARFLASLAVKSTLVVLVVTAFAVRLSERDFLTALTGWHLPPKVVGLCYSTVHSLHVVRHEILRLLRARDARGRPRGLRAVRTAAAIAQVLLIRLGRRAETQAFALCARGYQGRIALSEWRGLSWSEVLALALCALLLLCLIRVS